MLLKGKNVPVPLLAPVVLFLLQSHESEKDRIVNKTNGGYKLSFVTQLLRNGKPSHDVDSKYFVKMTSS